jgi:hypothetical protein
MQRVMMQNSKTGESKTASDAGRIKWKMEGRKRPALF